MVADPRVGGSFSFTMLDRFGTSRTWAPTSVIDRPRALEFTWRSQHTNQDDSVVPGHVRARRRRHHGRGAAPKLPDGEAARNHSEGWTEILGRSNEP